MNGGSSALQIQTTSLIKLYFQPITDEHKTREISMIIGTDVKSNFLHSPTLLIKAACNLDASEAAHLKTQGYILKEGTYRDKLETNIMSYYIALV